MQPLNIYDKRMISKSQNWYFDKKNKLYETIYSVGFNCDLD